MTPKAFSITRVAFIILHRHSKCMNLLFMITRLILRGIPQQLRYAFCLTQAMSIEYSLKILSLHIIKQSTTKYFRHCPSNKK